VNESTDQQLLRDYSGHRSEAAFSELVRRHIDLVHSAAFRMTGEAHSAQDVTQAVFVELAQNAARLAVHPVLSGWLHTTARNLAAKNVRTAARRQNHEQEVAAMNELLSSGTDVSWEAIAPHLDAALGELSEPDRDAVLLRYFEKKSAQEMAAQLGISDEAAQKRVSRAVERLREFFAKCGVTVGASGLAVVISANAVQAAPVGLAVIISTAAVLTGTTLVTTATVTATKAIAMTALQKTIVTTTIAVLAGAGIYEARQAAQLREQNQMLQQQQTPLAEQIQQLEIERDDASNRLALLANDLEKTKINNTELLKLRGEVTRLRESKQQNNDPIESEMKSWLVRVDKLKQRLAETPEAKIPEMRLLGEEAFKDATSHSHLNTERDYLAAMSDLRSAAEFKFITSFLNPALTQYAQANNGLFPSGLVQLQPYFPSPVEDAILDRWEIVPGKTVRTDNFGDTIITTKAAVDEDFDPRYAVGLKGFASAGVDTAGHNGWGVISPDIILGVATKSYMAANNGQEPSDPSQILPYLTTPDQQAALEKMRKWNQKK
jgi:RNA polymerase sigma factor (sigma-70 family)